MTEENSEEEYFSTFDWGQMEHMANSGAEEDAPDVTVSRTVLTDVMINKRLVWDVSPHYEVERISAYLGLPPASDEGLNMEHREAHKRTEGVLVLGPHINLLAESAARAVYSNMIVMGEHEESTPLDSEDFKEQTDALEVVIFNSALAIISELVDWGLLHTPYIVTPEEFEELKRARAEQEKDPE